MRPSKRAPDEMRKVTLERGVARYAEGSCLIAFGETKVICAASARGQAASLAARARPWLGDGRIRHAAARHPRAHPPRGIVRKPSGRTQEIQRLIGRSLRAVTDLVRSASVRSSSIAT